MSPNNTKEIEATLIVWSEKPDLIVGKIAFLTSIAAYDLLPAGVQTLHDIYLDTDDDALQALRLALRVREVDSHYWLTFKGPSRPIDSAGMERLEIEEPWSANVLTRVMAELAERRIKISEPLEISETGNPIEFLTGAGFKVVQERKTKREVRNVVRSEERGKQVFAEMAIDSVAFRFEKQEFQVRREQLGTL